MEGGSIPPLVSAQLIVPRLICLRLFAHFIRLAASRIFWTAGSSRPIRIAMMAMTTNSSIRVNPGRVRARTASRMGGLLARTENNDGWKEQVVPIRHQHDAQV